MAWVPPRIWSIGQLVTAADLNEQVRDNFLFLKSLVNDDGKIPAISSTYFADLSGINLTGVMRLNAGNVVTAGIHNFNGGSTTRLIIPVGINKWAAL